MTMTYAALAASLASLTGSFSPTLQSKKDSPDESSSTTACDPVATTLESEDKEEDKEEDMDMGLTDEDEGNRDSDIASSRAQSPIHQFEKIQDNHISTSLRDKETTFVSPVPPTTGQPVPSPSPGLKEMTEEQLYQAKVVMLDLLGWGVPPEYILQRGVSHELMYTVFTDLRLRLPESIVADCTAISQSRRQG